MSLTATEVAPLLEYTLLDPKASAADVEKLIADAQRLGVSVICVSPHLLSVASDCELELATVCGFPHGTHHPLIKATEARFAVQNGAVAVNLVPNLGAIESGDMNTLLAEIVAVREAITDQVTLNVILETAAFSAAQITEAAHIAAQAGADNIKTSTGYHPAGGATTEAVRLLKAAVSRGVGVQAAGGISTLEHAAELIAAGANRLGVSDVPTLLGN